MGMKTTSLGRNIRSLIPGWEMRTTLGKEMKRRALGRKTRESDSGEGDGDDSGEENEDYESEDVVLGFEVFEENEGR